MKSLTKIHLKYIITILFEKSVTYRILASCIVNQLIGYIIRMSTQIIAYSPIGYLRTDISGIDLASLFQLTHISLSFTLIYFIVPIFIWFYLCLWISSH